MNEALTYIFDIYLKFVNFIFDKAVIFEGVSIGWIFVSVFILGVLIRSLLAIPSKSQSYTFRGHSDE